MEAENARISQLLGTSPHLFQAVGPVLLISMGYIDPGKWAAVVEGGANFGFDLVLLMLVINCAAILCHYLVARIGVVTGKNLAQIYRWEYGKSTCLFFGVQAEVSVIVSDLTMIIGIAHGLNLLLGLDLRTCVLLTAIDLVFFPNFTTLLARCKTEAYFVSAAGFVFLFYASGVLMSQSEVPVVMNGFLTKFNGESAFVLMSLLGANIMPHNFYLYSYIVQQWQGPPNMSKSALCHDHFVAIFCIFSGIYLVNYVLMSSAATFFYSADLVVLTFQDALLLMDQVFKSPIAPIAFFLLLFISSTITGLTWNLGGEVVLHEFFRLDTPFWLHRPIIRLLALVPALYCMGNSGAEGMYQLLIFSQVILAMLLPSSVIPLLRVASSTSIMGALKISSFLEFLTLSTFMGMMGLKIMLVVEILFGSSDWVRTFRWTVGSSMTLPFFILLVTAFVSLSFLVSLAITPLKSEGAKQEQEQTLKWSSQRTLSDPCADGEENAIPRAKFGREESASEEPTLLEKVIGSSDNSVAEIDLDSSEMVMDSNQEPWQLVSQENCATDQIFSTCHPENTKSTIELSGVENADKEFPSVGFLDDATSKKIESVDSVPVPQKREGYLQIEKDDNEGDILQPEEELSKVVSIKGPTSPSEGPGSLKSLSARCEGGTGNGNLSRLSGLGRAARRQLAAILDEFWGQLYDFHGQATQQAKDKKLDVLLRQDPNPTASPNVGPTVLELPRYFPSVAERGSESLTNLSTYEPSNQWGMSKSLGSSNSIQTGSPLWATSMQVRDAHSQNSSQNALDYGEKGNSSLHMPPSSEGLGKFSYQPSIIEDYQIASYLAQIASERNPPDSLNAHLDPPNSMDQLGYVASQKPQNGISSVCATTQNLTASEINGLNAEQSCYDPYSSGFGPSVGSLDSTKKYHSLPRITSSAPPHQDSYGVDQSAQWDSYGFQPSMNTKPNVPSFYSDVGPRAGVPLVIDQLSSSNPYTETFAGQLNSNLAAKSLWSRQPFEQLFGIGGKLKSIGDGVGNRSNLVIPETNPNFDFEALLLQSFRCCIMKLLKLEGSEWLFSLNGGVDEDLIDLVAARERFHSEAETREANRVKKMGETPPQYLSSENKFGSALKNDEADIPRVLSSTVPNCGESCIWGKDLIVSFGIWCIRRVLELSLTESRPELWGKYTYVLNRLQGILELAFSKPRPPMPPCLCLQIPITQAKPSNPSYVAKPDKEKCTTAITILDIIKDVEIAVSCRKGKTGTSAGDVAFPKGKENLVSVLKRYKRRLSNKMFWTHEGNCPSFRKP